MRQVKIILISIFIVALSCILQTNKMANAQDDSDDIKFGKIQILRDLEQQCSGAAVLGQSFSYYAKGFKSNNSDIILKYNGEDHKVKSNSNGSIFGEITVPQDWKQTHFGIQAIGDAEGGGRQISNGLLAITDKKECKDANAEVVYPESFSIIDILGKGIAAIDESIALAPKFFPENTSNKNIIYESENPSVATVSETKGIVTGVSIGETTINATSINGKLISNISIKIVSNEEWEDAIKPVHNGNIFRETIFPIAVMIFVLLFFLALLIFISLKVFFAIKYRNFNRVVAEDEKTDELLDKEDNFQEADKGGQNE